MGELNWHVAHFFKIHPEHDPAEHWGPQTKREIVEQVNAAIDQFAHYPDMRFLRQHRRYLHHREGVAYFELAFGMLGAQAAELHIRDDTEGNLPRAADYYDGTCDAYGCLRELAIGERP